jgi:hypothetical protein
LRMNVPAGGRQILLTSRMVIVLVSGSR